MKQLFALPLLILLSCNMNETDTIDTTKQDPNEINSIKKILTSQQDCWNNGDIDGFMQGYWNSEELIFTSPNQKPIYGWKETLNRYKNNYPTQSSMGELRFNILALQLTATTNASIKGEWELIRKKDNPKGVFWLDLKKFNDNWLIIKDSTISL